MIAMRLAIPSFALAILSFPALAADPALLNLVMPDAKVVMGIDVVRAKTSPFGQMLLAEMDSKGNTLSELTSATGFDPRRDLSEVVFASNEASTPRGRHASGLIVARGNFDANRIRGFALQQGFAPANHSGVEIYSKTGDNASFAFLDNGIAVAGGLEFVQAAVLRRGVTQPGPAALLPRISQLSQDNDVWLVTSIPVANFADRVPEGGAGGANVNGMMKGDAFRAIEQAAMGLRFAADLVSLSLEAVARTEKDATAMADVVRFLAGMMQLNREKPELAALATALDSLKLTTEARTVKVNVSMPQAEIEKLYRSRKAARPARRI